MEQATFNAARWFSWSCTRTGQILGYCSHTLWLRCTYRSSVSSRYFWEFISEAYVHDKGVMDGDAVNECHNEMSFNWNEDFPYKMAPQNVGAGCTFNQSMVINVIPQIE